jgi:tetratricopeptide (TPR) repeat protein
MNKNLVVYEYTDFGRYVNQATQYYYEGNYELAKEAWEEVLVLNTNYFLAYSGIGKALLREGDYENAMKYAKLGYDDYTYSSAYQPYRYSKMVTVFPYIIGGAIGVFVFSFGRTIVKSVLKSREEEEYGE